MAGLRLNIVIGQRREIMQYMRQRASQFNIYGGDYGVTGISKLEMRWRMNVLDMT